MTLVPISEASYQLKVSVDTIRNWHKKGIIRAQVLSNGKRLFDTEEISRLQAKKSAKVDSDGFQVLSLQKKNGYTAIDLFAGAGGTAIGLENAGFSHIMLNEIDKDAVTTLRTNRPDWTVIGDDVAAIDFTQYRGKVDLIEGGFPCQAFSYAGKGKGFADIRGTLFFEFARAIEEAEPKVFMGENVRGLQRHDKGRTLKAMINRLHQIRTQSGLRYHFTYKIFRSQYHDVAQKRERLVIFGVREDVGEQIFFPKENNYIVTLRDILTDVPDSPGAKYSETKRRVLEQVPAGGYWRDLPEDVQKSYMGRSFYLGGGRTGIARRMSWDEPSLTLTCSPAQKQTERCHPEETRPFTVREYARIQSFPDDWDFQGSLAAQYKQIGNAVPCNLAYHLGRALTAMLDDGITGDNTALNEDFDIVEPLLDKTN